MPNTGKQQQQQQQHTESRRKVISFQPRVKCCRTTDFSIVLSPTSADMIIRKKFYPAFAAAVARALSSIGSNNFDL